MPRFGFPYFLVCFGGGFFSPQLRVLRWESGITSRKREQCFFMAIQHTSVACQISYSLEGLPYIGPHCRLYRQNKRNEREDYLCG